MSPPELKEDGKKITEMSVRDFALKYKLDQSRLEQVFDLKNLTGKKITDDKFRSILADAKVGSEVYERFSIYSMPPYMKTTDFAFSNRAKVDALLNFIVNASDEKAEGSASKALEVRKSISVVLGDYLLVLEKENRKPLLKEAKTVDAEVVGQPAEKDKLKATSEAQPEGGSWFARSWGKTKKFFSSTEDAQAEEKKTEESKKESAIVPVIVTPKEDKTQVQTPEVAAGGGYTARLLNWFKTLFSSSEKVADSAIIAQELKAQAKSSASVSKENEKPKAEKEETISSWSKFLRAITPSAFSETSAPKAKETSLSAEELQAAYGFSAQNAQELIRLAGSKNGISKSELVDVLASTGLSYAYASPFRITKTWDAEALLGLLEKKSKSKDEELDSEVVRKKLGEGLAILKTAKPGEISDAIFKNVKNRALGGFYSLSKNAEVKGEFISEIRDNLGVSEEVVERYCKEFGVSNKDELFERMKKNNYQDLWRDSFWGRVAAWFKTPEKLLSGMLDETEENEMVRYAMQFEAAMLSELAVKKAVGDRAEVLIPNLFSGIGRLEDIKRQVDDGKMDSKKFSMLMLIGLAYDGVESIRERMPELIEKVPKEKYLNDSISILAEALCKDGKLREGTDLRSNINIAASTIGSGYFFVIKNEATYKGGELLRQYKLTVEDMGKTQADVESLAKEGIITKKDAEKFNADALYTATYSMIYQMHQNARNISPENKAQLKALGISNEADVRKAASDAASMVINLSLQEEYVHHLDPKKEQEAYFHARDSYSRQLNEIQNSLNFKQNVEFSLSLIRSSAPGEKAHSEWKSNKGNAKKGYGDFVSERIEQKWAQLIPEKHLEAINSAIASTEIITESGKTAVREKIENNAENRKLYAGLAFRGIPPQDIVVATTHFNKSLKEVAEAYSALEKDTRVKRVIAKTAEQLGFTGKYATYSGLLSKTILPWLAMTKLSSLDEKESAKLVEKSLARISEIDIAVIRKEAADLKNSKDTSGASLPVPGQRAAEMNHRAFLFLKNYEKSSAIGYGKWEKKEVAVEEKPVVQEMKTTSAAASIERLVKRLGLGVDLTYKTGKGAYQNVDFLSIWTKYPEKIRQVQELFNALISEKFITVEDLQNTHKLIKEDTVRVPQTDKRTLLACLDKIILQVEAKGKVDFGSAGKYDIMTLASVHAMQVWAREVQELKNGDSLGEVTVADSAAVKILMQKGLITKGDLDILYPKDKGSVEMSEKELKKIDDLVESKKNELKNKMVEVFVATKKVNGVEIEEYSFAQPAKKGGYSQEERSVFEIAFRTHDTNYVRNSSKDDLNDGFFGVVTATVIQAAAKTIEQKRTARPMPESEPEIVIVRQPAATFISAQQEYTRPLMMSISMMPDVSTVAPVLPYHSLFVPQEISTVTGEGIYGIVGGGYGAWTSVQATNIGAAISPHIRIDINTSQVVGVPNRATVEAILRANGITNVDMIDEAILRLFTVDANGNITGLNTGEGATLDTRKIPKKEELEAQLLKERQPAVLGLLYRGKIGGADVSLMPTVNIPMGGKGANIYSIMASAQIMNYNYGPFSFGVTAGGMGSAVGGISPIGAVTAGYDFGRVAPYISIGGGEKGVIAGVGTSLRLGNNIISVNGTYAPGLFGVVSLQLDRPGMGVIGISGIILGGMVVIMPFLIGDITRPVNYMLEKAGIDRTLDTVARVGELKDLLPKRAGTPKKADKGE